MRSITRWVLVAVCFAGWVPATQADDRAGSSCTGTVIEQGQRVDLTCLGTHLVSERVEQQPNGDRVFPLVEGTPAGGTILVRRDGTATLTLSGSGVPVIYQAEGHSQRGAHGRERVVFDPRPTAP
ncbi:MAG: hypothetical protein KC619_12695 [Myxococcales bacterium]|nr:hypothetical protein [Myxococcales bacterium]